MTAPIPRLFTLRRDRDVSGVSGPGDVADGVQWADGTVALRWRAQPSTSLWDSLDLMLSVHGHDGATRVVWLYDATVSMTEHLEAANRAQLEIERLRGVAGRAYLLADRWQAAHGQSMFLVRAAGAELRDELDDERPQSNPAATQATDHTCTTACRGLTGIRGLLEHAGIDTSGRDIRVADRLVDAAVDADNTAWCGSRARHDAHNWVDYASPRRCPGHDSTSQEGPTRNVAAAVEVRDPCPFCEGCPLIPRTLMDDHVREHHPEVHTVEPGAPVPPAADGEVERARDLLLARLGEDQADVIDRLIRAVERRSYCDLPHEMEV